MTEPGSPPRTEPTEIELSVWVGALLEEIDAALSSDAWAILNVPTPERVHLQYDAAALRHCAAVLEEIEAAARLGRELSVRVLARTHIEAFLYALYIHFGGHDAVMRIQQDTRRSLETTHRDLAAFDQQLKREKKRLTKRRSRIRRDNAANSAWNAEHPDQAPRPITDEPYVPQLSTTGVDHLGAAIAEFGEVQARSLSVRDVVEHLTKWAPEMGFGRESLIPMYHNYRVFSTGPSHPNRYVLEAYLRLGGYVRSVPTPSGPSMILDVRVTSLYYTAFLAGWVLSSPTPVANDLRDRLQPDPSGQRGWAPGT